MSNVIKFQGEKVKVLQLYIGKRDCCRCGCGGRYLTGMASIKKHLKEHADEFESARIEEGLGKEHFAEINLGRYANGEAKCATLYFEYA